MSEQSASVSVFQAGVGCRCPRCGQANLFRGHFTLDVAPGCSACGLDFKFIDSGDGPAVFAVMIMGILMLGGALAFEFTVHPPIWVHILIWVPVTLILAFGLLRPLKATLIALQFRNRAEEARLARD